MSASKQGQPQSQREDRGLAESGPNDSIHRPLSPTEQHRLHHGNQGLTSPYFIHSRLDNVLGTSRREPPSYFDSHSDPMPSSPGGEQASNKPSQANRYNNKRPEPRHRGAQGAVEPESGSDNDDASDASTSRNGSSRSYSGSSESHASQDEDDRVRSLTRQLAETAVGVREMSKQLGRARVKSTIQSVLIITKARDNHLIKLTRELAIWLMDTPRNGKDRGLTVYVDAQLRQSKRFDAEGIRRDYPHLFVPISMRQQQPSPEGEADSLPSSANSSRMSSSMSSSREDSQLRYWTSDMCSRSPHLFDFVVTLGGDGTVLFCSWLFQRIVPPVLPFSLGSLGFLTNFDFSDYRNVLKSALESGIRVNLRMRFTATVYRATLPLSSTIDRRRRRAIKSGKTGEIIMRNIQEGGWDRIETPLPSDGDLRGTFTESSEGKGAASDRPALERPAPDSSQRGEPTGKKDKEVMCFSTKPVETFEVLNDLVVDRGPSPYVSLLEVFGDEHHMTTAQADGLCISTPTGSTAYSLSAGGSLVHPEIPAILITPICPHTLSFRPMQLPDSMELRIAVPYNSRSTAWASFDGRGRVELKQGDHIKVTASKYPFPTVCAENQSKDWFESISRTLKWNERQRQKSFVVLEEGGEDEEKARQVDRKGKAAAAMATAAAEEAAAEASNKAPEQKRKGEEGGEEEEEDEDEDEEEEEEAFDIDDTSTAATRASSPDPGKDRHRSHHHHHRRRSTQEGDNGSHLRHPSSSSSISSLAAPPVVGTNHFLQKLRPLTSNKAAKESPTSPPALALSDDASATSLNVHRGAEDDHIGGSGAYKQSEDGQGSTSATEPAPAKPTNSQHGVIQPCNRSLLDSPDRFGLAGPPQPPRAISERHLATADFRLDGGRAEEGEAAADGSRADRERPATEQKTQTRSRSNSKRADAGDQTLVSPRQEHRKAGSGEEEGAQPLLNLEPKLGSSSKGANRLYRKLRSRVKAERSAGREGRPDDDLELTRNNSRGGGTALVVYGQDESDSDSTAEG